MFLKEYLNKIYLSLLIDKYEENYLNSLDQEKFLKIYNLLKKYKFYFIEDIIITYLELFELEETKVEQEIINLKEKLGDNFVYLIGNDLSILSEILYK